MSTTRPPGHSASPAYYSQGNIDILADERRAAHAQLQEINFAVLGRTFTDARAHEYATQGLLRRLLIMARCIDVVFDILPPDRAELPTRDELSAAAAQALDRLVETKERLAAGMSA